MADAPDSQTISDFFSNNAKRIALYFAVKQMIDSIGPATAEVMKTQISFGTAAKFAWVWLPPKGSRKRPEHCVVLTFGVSRPIISEQIVQSVQPYPDRWTHHLIIIEETDLNENVLHWLREAYAFSLERGKQKFNITDPLL